MGVPGDGTTPLNDDEEEEDEDDITGSINGAVDDPASASFIFLHRWYSFLPRIKWPAISDLNGQ